MNGIDEAGMFELISDVPLMLAFLGASLVLAVTPGPGVLYIVAHSVTQGRRFALASVGGVAAGNWCNAIGASIGLAALFASIRARWRKACCWAQCSLS